MSTDALHRVQTDALDGDALSGFTDDEGRNETPEVLEAPAALRSSHAVRYALIALVIVSAAVTSLVYAAPRWIRPAPPVVLAGSLTINSTPLGVSVFVDGIAVGATPVKLTVASGEHVVLLRRATEDRTLTVTINPGSDVIHDIDFAPVVEPAVTAPSPVPQAPPPPAGPVAGWVTIAAPFDIQVFDGRDLVGAGAGSKIMLAAGHHALRLTNATIGYDEARNVEIAAGKTTALRVDPPKSALSANARPWANVFVDGTDAGQTPIANLLLPIGSHQIVFRHPDLGEQRQTVVVTSKGPNRVSADMTKK